ncbi:MAG: threonine aldolase [Oscillibacter sp.]|nr:threonine aldolase [Oscillibacter sp.]
MLYFRNDYGAGAHPAVLEALCRTNGELTAGYGADRHCLAAAETIRELCRSPEAEVHFLVGGTQVNKTAIGAFLRPWEAAAAASAGHICVHEAGAIEQGGHKILPIPSRDGKLTPAMLRSNLGGPVTEHEVVPRLVYISNTSELGTVYTAAELSALREACDEQGLLLYCDGARLGSAMDAGGTDFADYARTCDAFTIGGTKNGLLFGEALVIVNPALRPGFRNCMKQQGAMLAKGRLLGVQFEAVLRDGLYLELAAHANRLARRLAAGLAARGVPLLVPAESNQVFPILPDAAVDALRESAAFEAERKLDGGRTCVRFVTAWHTADADVDALLELL